MRIPKNSGAGGLRKLRIAGRFLLIAVVTAVILLISMALYRPGPLLDLIQASSEEAVFYFETEKPLVALTIDDGPDPSTTPAILDELKKHGATATFFVIVDRLIGNEAIIERMLEEGHELGNHGMHEEAAIGLSASEFEATVDSAQSVIQEYGGTQWYRPGSGFFDGSMLTAVNKRGLRMVLGSVYPYDVAIPSSAFASSFILRNVRPGSIIVVHDHGTNGERTLETLKTILPELAGRGVRVVNLGSCGIMR